jgi:hypothetical protein
MAQTAKSEADKATDVTREAADTAEDTARGGLRAVQRTGGALLEVERAVASRSAEGTAEFGQALTDLLKEQTQHNFKTMTALTEAVDWDQVAKAVDWDRVVQIQTEYLRVSLERTARLTQRYFEVSQAVLLSATSTVQRQLDKAA